MRHLDLTTAVLWLPLWLLGFSAVSPAQSPVFTTYPTPTANSGPNGIAAGPDGALWFTEYLGNQIGRITTSGTITEYPVPTSGAHPLSITTGADGALWFTEANAQIGRITTLGVITEYPLPTPNAVPEGITLGPDGAVWFAEDLPGGVAMGQIGRITTAGTITEYPVGFSGSTPLAITAGPDGALWFTDLGTHAVGRITTSGVVTEYSAPSGPVGITAGPDGALWFTELLDKIGRITTAGAITEYPITSGAGPGGIAPGPDGALWFTEFNGDALGRITTGGVVTEFPIPNGSFSQPEQITTGSDGALWFAQFTVSQIGRAALTLNPLLFVPVTPCRVVDTRNAPGPLGGPGLFGNSRDFPIPTSPCGIPADATAYSLNVTVAPNGPLGYLTIWPTGQSQPVVSTLNSKNGIVKADAAIVPAGTNGSVSVYGSAATDVVLDINGYFIASDPAGLAFYPVTPCRVVDTRNAPGPLGGPIMTAGQTRAFPLRDGCSIPSSAEAYALNFTVVPGGTPLGYLTTWPDGETQPVVSTLNAPTGLTTANAAIVPAGSAGVIDVYTSAQTHVVIDINGYFAPPDVGGLSFYVTYPCRAVDTRNATGPLGGPAFLGQRDFPLSSSGCGLPTNAQAYSLNATVVPPAALGYLTLWPTGETQPVVSTLNSPDGATDSNAAIVPTLNGSISAYASAETNLILDVNGYFAPAPQ